MALLLHFAMYWCFTRGYPLGLSHTLDVLWRHEAEAFVQGDRCQSASRGRSGASSFAARGEERCGWIGFFRWQGWETYRKTIGDLWEIQCPLRRSCHSIRGKIWKNHRTNAGHPLYIEVLAARETTWRIIPHSLWPLWGPDLIFPWDSFCSVNAVLCPRKPVRFKRRAANQNEERTSMRSL